MVGCFASLAEKGLLLVRQKLRFFSYMCAVESRPLELCLLKNNFKFVQVIGGVRVVVVDLKEKRCACGELSTPIQQAGLILLRHAVQQQYYTENVTRMGCFPSLADKGLLLSGDKGIA